MRSNFDEQLANLNKEMIQLGALCETAISSAAEALNKGNKSLTKNTIALSGEIDQFERDIESLCLKLLLQQQPVARDLRQISSALKMVTDLERIGDQAADIAEIISYHQSGSALPRQITLISEMARSTIHMVTESVNAYVDKDLDKAKEVITYDDVVDGLFYQVKDQIISYIAQHPEQGQEALDALMIAKYFERIGDHAARVAGWVAFSITGVFPEIS